MRLLTGRVRPFEDLGLLILRLAAGGLLAWHGWTKLTDDNGIDSFASYLSSLGFPAPTLLSWVTSIAEFGGGIALVLGLLARPLALGFLVEFGIIIVYVKYRKEHSHIVDAGGKESLELELLYLAAFATLLSAGPGRLSLDALFGRKRRAAASPVAAPAVSPRVPDVVAIPPDETMVFQPNLHE